MNCYCYFTMIRFTSEGVVGKLATSNLQSRLEGENQHLEKGQEFISKLQVRRSETPNFEFQKPGTRRLKPALSPPYH